MKTKITVLCLSLLAAAARSFTLPWTIDTTTIQPGRAFTNIVWVSTTNGANFSVTNGCERIITTNTPVGELLTNAWNKLASNELAVANFSVTNQYRYFAPSNYFNLFNLTNGMNPGDIKTFNSNGLALCSLWLSNSVPVIAQLLPAAPPAIGPVSLATNSILATNVVAGLALTNEFSTNGLLTHATVTNSVLTNSTYAGNGFYLTSLNGTNLSAGTVRTNVFGPAAMSYFSGLAAGYPDITDDHSAHIGINNGSPGYPLDVTGGGYITAQLTGTDYNRAAFLFASQAEGVQYEFGVDSSFSGTHDFYVYDSSAGAFILQIDQFQSATFGNNVIWPGSMNSDDGALVSDGAGNLTCTTLTQTSDVNTKTNIVALNDDRILNKISSIPVYRWNFRDRLKTNYVPQLTGHGTTNFAPRMRTNILSNVTHIGPMAQDWAARFGGRTNAISILDMQGILLAGEQALADPARIAVTPFLKLTPYTVSHATNATFGYGPGLLAADGNYLYISTATNTWRRLPWDTNAW